MLQLHFNLTRTKSSKIGFCAVDVQKFRYIPVDGDITCTFYIVSCVRSRYERWCENCCCWMHSSPLIRLRRLFYNEFWITFDCNLEIPLPCSVHIWDLNSTSLSEFWLMADWDWGCPPPDSTTVESSPSKGKCS